MNILFVLLRLPYNKRSGDMYLDMAQVFVKNGHQVTVICGTGESTSFKEEGGMRVLRVKSKPVLYVKNMIKKGIGMFKIHYINIRYLFGE